MVPPPHSWKSGIYITSGLRPWLILAWSGSGTFRRFPSWFKVVPWTVWLELRRASKLLSCTGSQFLIGFIHDFFAIDVQKAEVVFLRSFEFFFSYFLVESSINPIEMHHKLVTVANFAAQLHQDLSNESCETNFYLMLNLVILDFISGESQSVSEFFYGTDDKARKTVEDLVIDNSSCLSWLPLLSLPPVFSWSLFLRRCQSGHPQIQWLELERFMINRLRFRCSYCIGNFMRLEIDKSKQQSIDVLIDFIEIISSSLLRSLYWLSKHVVDLSCFLRIV